MPNTLGYYYPRLRLQCSGAPEQILGDSVLRAMATIARKSGAFRKDITPIAFVDGTATYAVSEDGFRIIDYSKVHFIQDTTITTRTDDDKTPIDRITQAEMRILLQDVNSGQRPEAWAPTLGTPGSIDIYPFTIAETNAEIQVTATVVPTRLSAQSFNMDADTAHWGAGSFFDINEELIWMLALAYTLDYPNKAWSNRGYAQALMQQADRDIGEMKSLADDDMRSGTPRAVKYGGY